MMPGISNSFQKEQHTARLKGPVSGPPQHEICQQHGVPMHWPWRISVPAMKGLAHPGLAVFIFIFYLIVSADELGTLFLQCLAVCSLLVHSLLTQSATYLRVFRGRKAHHADAAMSENEELNTEREN